MCLYIQTLEAWSGRTVDSCDNVLLITMPGNLLVVSTRDPNPKTNPSHTLTLTFDVVNGKPIIEYVNVILPVSSRTLAMGKRTECRL